MLLEIYNRLRPTITTNLQELCIKADNQVRNTLAEITILYT